MTTQWFKVIPIEGYSVVVDNSKIEWKSYFLYNKKEIRYCTNTGTEFHGKNECYISGNKRYPIKDCKKIIFSIGKRFNGVSLIELIADTEKKMLEADSEIIYLPSKEFNAAIRGHKANTNKYSEEDMSNLWQFIVNGAKEIMLGSSTPVGSFEEYIQSLQKQSIPTEVELEMEDYTTDTLISVPNDETHPIYETDYRVKIINKQTNTITAVNYK